MASRNEVRRLGRTSFQDLQNAFTGGPRRGLVYFVFDLLHTAGESIGKQPLEARKHALVNLVGKPRSRARIKYSEHVTGQGRRMFAEACRLGLEGIGSKRRDAPYKAGRADTWLKTKCVRRQEFVVRERGELPPASVKTWKAPRSASHEVSGVRITHPDRVMYPDAGLTKLDVAKAYADIADWILPHLQDRPLTLVRCPEGIAAGCFYMKHSKVWAPGDVRRVHIQEKTKVGEYLVVDTLPALVGLVQMNVLEIHTWNSRTASIECPDRIVIDIDPGVRITWPRVIDAARLVRRLLHHLDLDSFVKTTGGRGLHVVVPLAPRADWTKCLGFARSLAEAMVRHDPATFTTTFAKAGRERKILIDYLRNNRTNTSIAAYSTRARPGAPVSVPIRWDELKPALDPLQWSIGTIRDRVTRLRKDPWSGYADAKQRLTASLLAAVEGI